MNRYAWQTGARPDQALNARAVADGRGAPTSTSLPGDTSLAVTAGLAGGAQVTGRLQLRGAGRVIDRLNNWVEPTLELGPKTVLVRVELVWIAALESEPVPWAPNGGARFTLAAAPQARRVVIHAGLFELHGAVHTYPGASWSDFLAGHFGPSAYFGLAEARITGPNTSLDLAAVAVNADRISALLSLD